MIRPALLLFLLPMIAILALPTEQTEEGDIPRFAIVSHGLYRGGQPTEDGFRFLKEAGIKTIINLRAEDNSEMKLVEKLGIHYIQIPVDEARPWSEIPAGAIAKYFELIGNPANYPIFFHCRRGADRTGAFAAFYRIAIQHWDNKRAHDEARRIGMRWYYTGLRSQIYNFHPPAPGELQETIKSQ